MSAPLDDSLDNLSAMQVSRHRSLVAQVKHQFITSLQKLQFSETREIGINELRKITEKYCEPENLRSFMATLKSLKPNTNSATKEHQILVISILAQSFREKLLDPIDKPPSLLKSCFRLVQVLLGYFADRSPTVQRACARALLDVNTHCLSGQGLDSVFQIVYSPLLSILRSGVDKGSQGTASACLDELISYNRSVNDQQTIAKLAPELLTVFIKVNSQYHELFHSIVGILEIQGLSFLEGRVVGFLSKILAVLAGTKDTQAPNTLNNYMCKVNVCKIVEQLGHLLSQEDKDKLVDLNVAESLQKAARHRVIQVQMAASRALKSWKGVVSQSPKAGLSSLEAQRDRAKRERSRSKDMGERQKQERQRMQSELTFMKEDLQKMVKGGWGASNRAKNYVKRGSGVGGGYHGRMEKSPQSRSSSRSHQQHIQQLRQYIKKGTQQNRKLDRFAPARLLERDRSTSPPPKRQVRKAVDDDGDEFGMEEDEGEQMFAPASKVKPKQRLQDVEITPSQVRQLRNHEDSLLEEGRQMNVRFSTQKSQKSQANQEEVQDVPTVHQEKASQEANHQNQPETTPAAIKGEITSRQEGREKKPAVVRPTRDSVVLQPEEVRISQQQIGQLIQECNLSQVSDNLSGLLNESDLIEAEGRRMMETAVFEPQNGKEGIQVLREAVAEKKARASMLEPVGDNTLPPDQSSKPPLPSPSKKSVQQQIEQGLSLNLTESAASRIGQREDIQFTLRPEEAGRFSSLQAAGNPQQEKEIEEDIVMSCYQESVPKQEFIPPPQPPPLPPAQLPTPDRRPFQPQGVRKNEKVPQDRSEYQSIIRNPPTKGGSVLKASKAKQIESKNRQPVHDECDPGVGIHWLQALKLFEANEYNAAFELLLELDDPIYLLRGLLLAKCPVRQLSAVTAQQLWRTFLTLYSHHLVDSLAVSLFQEANDLELLGRCLAVEQLQELLVGLYEVSGSTRGKLSYSAATLYNNIEEGLRGQK